MFRIFAWFKRKKKVTALAAPGPDVVIIREPSTDQGTFGVLRAADGFQCVSLELPDRDNQTNISRIPAGRYTCTPYASRRFGRVYLVEGVQGRAYILFHTGNLAGDVAKGFRTNSHGCILLGKFKGKLSGQSAVMVSRPVVRSFLNVVGDKDFILEIKEVA